VVPIDTEQLVLGLPWRFRKTVADRLDRGGVLPQKSAAALASALGELDPAAGRALARLRGTGGRSQLGGPGLQSAAQEADAVRLAIDIADLPRTSLREVRPDGETPFLQRLTEVRTGEDLAVAYDSMRFLDFDRLEHPSGIVRFAKGYERLTILNVNRQPLEHTTGADLIYVNETLGSFVLVQYKSFRRETSAGGSRLVYRPDKQLEAELERMRRIRSTARGKAVNGFRLHAGCCFLKLCKPVASVNYSPRELVTGMYLPLDYYDELVMSDIVRGPRGGVSISYENVDRYMNNDLFVQLVRGAWVGSRGVTTKRLTDLVVAGLDAGHSMTVAGASRTQELARTAR
jgi:hypothetical protein